MKDSLLVEFFNHLNNFNKLRIQKVKTKMKKINTCV